MTDYLVDNSVWARLASGDQGVAARLRRIERAPDEATVLDLQGALWSAGLVRSAGAVDLLIAAYALINEATVLTADRDFDHIARVSELRHEYIAPSS